MQAIKDRFDEGLLMENGQIRMDFTKLFGSQDGNIDDTEHQMLLFKELEMSQFQEYIEHPLCQAYIGYKFNKRVKLYFWTFFILPSILFAGEPSKINTLENIKMLFSLSVIFSIYSVLLFGNLCVPEKATPTERWEWNQIIHCHGWVNDEKEYTTVEITWVLLILLTIYFCTRDIFKCASLQRKFFTDAYRRLLIQLYYASFQIFHRLLMDVLLIICLYKGWPEQKMEVVRWQYHMASAAGFLLWLQVMIELGRYPGCGKYIMMFK